jgi:predicted P-loop ATPase
MENIAKIKEKSQEITKGIKESVKGQEPTTQQAKIPTEITYIQKSKVSQVKDYLSSKYLFRRDIIGNQVEFALRKDCDKWMELNENDFILELCECGLNLSDSKVLAIFGSSFVPNYNPIEEYFSNLPKIEGTKNIEYLASFVKAKNPDRFKHHFKKMLVRMVACGLGKQFNKQAFILVGGQDTGKSTFLRFLCPPRLKNYIKENLEIENKEGRIALSQNFIINLDEIDRLSKKDVAAVKQFISTERIKERLVYAKTDKTRLRVANFLGSTNKAEFLTDETGSVRFLCFDVERIDFSYKDNVNIDLVYAEAYQLLQSGFEYNLTKEEIKESESLNKNYAITSIEMDLVQKYCKKVENPEHKHFKTTTDILTELQNRHPNLKINNILLGKALTFFGFERKSITGGAKGYYLEFQ